MRYRQSEIPAAVTECEDEYSSIHTAVYRAFAADVRTCVYDCLCRAVPHAASVIDVVASIAVPRNTGG